MKLEEQSTLADKINDIKTKPAICKFSTPIDSKHQDNTSGISKLQNNLENLILQVTELTNIVSNTIFHSKGIMVITDISRNHGINVFQPPLALRISHSFAFIMRDLRIKQLDAIKYVQKKLAVTAMSPNGIYPEIAVLKHCRLHVYDKNSNFC